MAIPEPKILSIKFLDIAMGRLAWRGASPAFAMELTPEFLALGHDLSPLHLPLEGFRAGPRVFSPTDSPFPQGLPGLIADSLPDAWGERMLRSEVPGLQTVLGKLAAIGVRGPGALSFEPVLGSGADVQGEEVALGKLAKEAQQLQAGPAPLTSDQVLQVLARGGSSLGGAFPKTSAHLPLKGEELERKKILVGGPTPAGHVPCILKFSPADDEGGGSVEFAFWKLAQAAGLRVSRACLVHDGKRGHFACGRFDRYLGEDGRTHRRHVHTLSGMLHKRASDAVIDYEEFIRLTRRLCGMAEAEECLRRAIFNLLSTNRDDHGRNHAFLYDEESRVWTLTPAYDLTPNAANVLIGLSWMGSQRIPQRFEAVERLAEAGGISARKARAIFCEVEEVVFGQWRPIAKKAGVPTGIASLWEENMKSQTLALCADVHKDSASATKRKSK